MIERPFKGTSLFVWTDRILTKKDLKTKSTLNQTIEGMEDMYENKFNKVILFRQSTNLKC